MEDLKTYKVATSGKGQTVKGSSYATDASGTLTVYGETGEASAVFAPGQWHSILINSKDEEDEPKPASKKAEREAASLTDDQREVQDLQQQAQSGNPYRSKVDVNALSGTNEAQDTSLSNPPKAKK